MRLRIVSFFMLICLCVSLFPILGSAAGEISISTPEELLKIGVDPAFPLSGDYVLTADLDLSGRDWYPIGNPDGSNVTPFTGSFDGNGHKISGLTSGSAGTPLKHEDDGWGMFAYLNGATVKNLVLENVYFNVYAAYDKEDGSPAGYNGVGAVAGYINGGATVESVSVISSWISDLGSRQTRVGGIVGSVTGTGGSVRNCLFQGVVSGNYSVYDDLGYYNNQCAVAGIVGSAARDCAVESCLAVGTVSLNYGYGYAHPVAAYYMDAQTGASVDSCYYHVSLNLGYYGGPGTASGATEISEKDLYSGNFTGLGSGWTVKAGQIPYPSAAPVTLPETEFSQVEGLLTTGFKHYYASNFTTADDILSFVEKSLVGEFSLDWGEPFRLTKAGETPGRISGSVKVSRGTESVTVPFEISIDPLPELTYDFTSKIPGCAGGSVSVKSLPKSGQTCALRWGTSQGPASGYSPLAVFEDSGKKFNRVVKEKTMIPLGMTHLWLCMGDIPVLSLAVPAHRLRKAETPKYTFGVMSDLHLDGDGNVLAVDAVLRKFAADNVSFVVSLGDNTSNNKVEQLANWKKLQMKYPSLAVYSALGNHDILPRHTQGGIREFTDAEYDAMVADSFRRFQSYYENTEDYDYTLEQGDDLIIFLGLGKADDISEAGTKGGQALGQAQLDWLNDTLDQYYNKDKKSGHVFLMFHYYTRGTIDTITTASALQEASSKKLESVLAKYPGVVYFSGHNHYAFDANMNVYSMRPGYTLIHTPSAGRSSNYKQTGHNMGREAYYVEVYDDYVLVKGYGFLRDEWNPSAMFIVSTADSMKLSQGSDKVVVGGAAGESSAPSSPVTDGSTDLSSVSSVAVASGGSWGWIVAVAVAVIVLGIGIAAFFLLRKKKPVETK